MASLLRFTALWLVSCVAGLGLVASGRADEVKLARHPDYHNGRIVFSYLGDLWLMQEGSPAHRITVHKARDIHPRFSSDGKWIAFSSNRYGNYDVFVMPGEGGRATRLTYHSANDTVVGWTRDSKHVVFSSARGQPYGGIPTLFQVPVSGGLEAALPVDWGYWGSYSPDGKKLAFNRHPMTWSRKHYRGSYAADLWVYDFDKTSYTRLVDDGVPDEWKANNLWPMYANGEIYFVSDRNVKAKAGSPDALHSINNIWKVREQGGEPVQVTHHTSGALFFPSLSADGKTIIYEENFGLCKLDLASGQSTPIKIDIATDDADNTLESLTYNSEADSFGLSPSGKRAVISIHGELFSIATEKGETRRLTRTPGARETQPAWSPDGKRIAYIGDEHGREAVYICDEFGLAKKEVSTGDAVRGQLRWSPDSQALLFSSGKELLRFGVEDGKTLALIPGERGGAMLIQNPQWSPDGKWISFTKQDATFLPHVYVMPASGGQARRITDDSSYSDAGAHWTADGKYLVYLSGMELVIPISSIQGKSTAQVFCTALARETEDPADKGVDSEEAAAKQKPRKSGDGKSGDGKSGDGKAGDGKAGDGESAAKKPVEGKIDFEGIGRRSRQLTRTPDNIGSLAVSPDGKTVAFATSGVEGGRTVQSIWSVQIDGDKLTRVAQSAPSADEDDGPPRGGFAGGGLGSLQFARDGRTLFYQQGKSIYSTAFASGQGPGAPSAAASPGGRGPGAGAAATGAASPGKKLAFTVRVDVNHREQRLQVFRESWRVMKHRFYDPAMHGVNWDSMRALYEPLMDHVGTQDDLFDVVNMLLGELNASHTGISAGVGGGRGGNVESGRFPGFEIEPDKSGVYRVSHIYKNGPADKDYIKLAQGDFILAVGDEPLKAGDNYWKSYANTAGARMEFTVNDKPAPEGAWKARVTPVGALQHANLQYERWVEERRQMTQKLSGGEIGYLHIRQMSEPAYRKFERDLAQLRTKKALIIDQRFNPGGNIDQELLALLGLRQYQKTKVRDAVEATRPMRGFFGPMTVLANERSTSDAEVFPDGFRTLKLGKIVGVTTYGAVIGTGAYRLMDGSSLRTPSSGLWNVDGTNLENYGVRPDIYVDNGPSDYFAGRDRQLERAVEVLRTQMEGK